MRQAQLTHLIKCQLSDTWDSNWHILVTKQCQLNLNFDAFFLQKAKEQKTTGTIGIFDYPTANAGTSPPPTLPFLQGDENHRILSEKIKQ